jgi:putative two-component system response regulator
MRILIVDDDELSLQILQGVLHELGYQVETARDGQEALAKLRGGVMHIVITDWDMPVMNGLELSRTIRENDYQGYVYVIMLTSREGGRQKIEGLHAGADAFLTKPLNPEELLVSLKIAERILSLETRDLTLFALAKLSESRDPETGAHIERVQCYARILGQKLSTTDKYRTIIDAEFIRLLHQTTPLHDIGKVAIPDTILLKPGKLTPGEMAVMRTHAMIGARTLSASQQRFPNVRFLQMARDIAKSHHERWDGAGYPENLKGEQIPLAARIVAVADVYDALTSRRIYREALSHARAKELILQERGMQFDPDVVEAFQQTEKQFLAVQEQFADREADRSESTDASAEAGRPFPENIESGISAKQKPPQDYRILVVDDDAVTRSMISDFLLEHGFEVLSFANPLEALASVKEQRPRLIISDWEMPEMDGLELCRRVRHETQGTHVHFIMLTIHTRKEDLTNAFDAGVDDFLAKPFEEVELLARLRSGMRAAAFYEEIARQHQGSRQLNEQLISLNNHLESLAITDDLTGLFNRREAMRRLEEQWSLGDVDRRPITIAILDLDHFKNVNDQYGHSAGDLVLREAAEVMSKCLRGSDALYRIGGEEFLIILPFQTALEAELCANRCRESVAQTRFNHMGQVITTTLSAGVASRRADMLCSADLLAEADAALYLAKRGGRNRVQCGRTLGDNPPAAGSHAA